MLFMMTDFCRSIPENKVSGRDCRDFEAGPDSPVAGGRCLKV